jgi:hypothetical protein
VFNRAFETSLLNGEATVTQVGLIKLIAPGGGNDVTSPIFLHTTFDANGSLASSKAQGTPWRPRSRGAAASARQARRT